MGESGSAGEVKVRVKVKMNESADDELDIIAAYDRIAPGFRELSQARAAYLHAVDAEILRRVNGAASLIDIGAGDGLRAWRIAERSGIREIVLVEPSAAMRDLLPAGCEVWDARLESLPDRGRCFDVVLCLWNVLGHVPTRELRSAALNNLRALASASGMIFLDILNRYNVAECGAGVVLGRFLRDMYFPNDGDVAVRWRTSAGEAAARGHVFTPKEMNDLLREAGLKVVERLVLDYRSGERRSWAGRGNLLYVLKPAFR